MPITQSAKKALRQNIRRRKRNINKKRALKVIIKDYKKISATSKEEAVKLLAKVYKALDKAAKTNLIQKNKASRLKSRLSKKVNPVK
ncbi:MAG: 30S ribosomal protein S20 [Candidatus Brennerbacteria bacterium]|nr:30S ribosomal protein S20 [Candidatus Brennerbacteria bacterium]